MVENLKAVFENHKYCMILYGTFPFLTVERDSKWVIDGETLQETSIQFPAVWKKACTVPRVIEFYPRAEIETKV